MTLKELIGKVLRLQKTLYLEITSVTGVQGRISYGVVSEKEMFKWHSGGLYRGNEKSVFINNTNHCPMHRFCPKKGKTIAVLKAVFKNSSGSISHCPIPEIKGVYV